MLVFIMVNMTNIGFYLLHQCANLFKVNYIKLIGKLFNVLKQIDKSCKVIVMVQLFLFTLFLCQLMVQRQWQ